MSSFKKKKETRYTLSKSDIDFYKMTGVFAIACVFVLLALKMQDSGMERISSGRDLTYNFYMFCHSPLFIIVAAAALIGSVVWFAVSKFKKTDESGKVFTSTNCLSIVLYLGFFSACFGISSGSNLHGFFIAVTIAAAVLYYVSKIYRADFVFYSAITAVFAMCIYLWALNFDVIIICIKVLIIAAGVASCVVFNKKLSAMMVTKKTRSSFLMFPSYISLALGTIFLFWGRAFTVISPLFLSRVSMLVILFVQFIVFAIIYTIRLIKE